MLDLHREQPNGLSLLEANCAAACLEFKGRLGTCAVFAGMYENAAGRIQDKMGDNPDIDGDPDTRVNLNPFDRFITRRAAQFVLGNSELIIDEQVQGYISDTALLLTYDERGLAISRFRELVVTPAVGRLASDATQLQERL